TRYAMKYRHCDGKLVLKVTDDKEVVVIYTVVFRFKTGMQAVGNPEYHLMNFYGPSMGTPYTPCGVLGALDTSYKGV
ncbi:unnamed protein product, partial [Ilex paraguariensis]